MMIGCYATGMFPRPNKLIAATRAYERGALGNKALEKAFKEATLEVVKLQESAGLSHVTDGMLKWQDLLRPFAENLGGVKVDGLARWFDNNTFYKTPVIVGALHRNGSITKKLMHVKLLPSEIPWKAILPAPYTFIKLSKIQLSKSKRELMFEYARILRDEIEELVALGFKYVQLSDPALVYNPFYKPISKDLLSDVKEALKTAVKGTAVKTCLQTFFGDFCQILPEALDFPVDHLGIDLCETSLEGLKGYSFRRGVALGLVNSRSSLVEDQKWLVETAKRAINLVQCASEVSEIFICPNCDLEFLPWKKAEEKLCIASLAAKTLRRELDG
jgi:5-methyltetrahydropteroyltriglutamate--homocysteine methyltransferase